MQPGQPAGRARVRWVATAPPGALPPRRAEPSAPYTGPPSYPAPPYWGFPHLVWRWPTEVPGTSTGAGPRPERLRMVARNARALLWTVAALATLAGGAEAWRYALLVISRDAALSAPVVGASDAMVLVFALLTFVVGLLAIAWTMWWLFVARSAAAAQAAQRPSRAAWQVVLGTLVPGPNLVLAGPIVAELEHAALRRAANVRPRPSRLVLVWWGAWLLNAGLLVSTVLWRLRDGVQADANGVLLNACTDLAAATLAVLTALLVDRITRLLTPIDGRRLRSLLLKGVMEVRGAPEPSRRERPATATR